MAGCWEPNPYPLQEKPVLLIPEQCSNQSYMLFMKMSFGTLCLGGQTLIFFCFILNSKSGIILKGVGSGLPDGLDVSILLPTLLSAGKISACHCAFLHFLILVYSLISTSNILDQSFIASVTCLITASEGARRIHGV